MHVLCPTIRDFGCGHCYYTTVARPVSLEFRFASSITCLTDLLHHSLRAEMRERELFWRCRKGVFAFLSRSFPPTVMHFDPTSTIFSSSAKHSVHVAEVLKIRRYYNANASAVCDEMAYAMQHPSIPPISHTYIMVS